MNFRISHVRLAAALIAGAALPGVVSAMAIDKSLTINVYQVCDDAGANCADTGASVGDTYFAAATNKIWSQAGISIGYNFAGTINNSLFLNIDDAIAGQGFFDIASTTGNAQSASVVDMFLVRTIEGSYGEGWDGAGGLVMAMDTIIDYAPGGRIDTMAHELGHNFGLSPLSDPEYAGAADPGHSTDPNQLMASGSIRNVPSSLVDINPDGFGFDRLSPFHPTSPARARCW